MTGIYTVQHDHGWWDVRWRPTDRSTVIVLIGKATDIHTASQLMENDATQRGIT